MKYLIQLEELGIFALAVFGLYLQPLQFPWWAWTLIFLSPDLGIAGYWINPVVGAFLYNLLHHRFVGVAVLAAGYFMASPYLLFAGPILLGHSSFDRALGYGLKLSDDFKHTHLGWIGRGSGK